MDDIVPMKRMLISKQKADSLKMGIIEDGYFTEIDTSDKQFLNIYYGVIKSIEEDHVAVDYGASHFGVLPIKNVSENYFNKVEQRLEVGQNIIVQIMDESENPLLSTFITLTGSLLKISLKNLNPISGKSLSLSDYKESEKEYEISPDFSFMILKGHENKTSEELEWDLNVLMHHWQAIKDVSLTREPTFLIHKEYSPLITPVKKSISEGVTEIFVDDKELFTKIKAYFELVNSALGVFYYDLPDNLINKYRWISWETIKENQKTAKKMSLWSKALNLFSKKAISS